MSFTPSTATSSSGIPSRRLLWCLTGLLSLTALTASSGVNCCPDERKTPPPETAFVKVELSGTGAGFPTWHTKSPGRPLLLLHALNGISPSLLHWALEMETWGYRVYIPSLYGDPIQEKPAYGYDEGFEAAQFLAELPAWDLNSTDHPGAIVDEVRALAREVSAREGNRKIAVLGNCLTGIFPLAILDEPCVQLAVVAQPALPVMKFHEILLRQSQAPEKQKALPLSPGHFAPLLTAMRDDSKKRVIGFHYAHDPIAPIVKFDELHRLLDEAGLGKRFTAYVLAREKSSYAADRPDWVVGGITSERRKMLTPHSTLSNPESRQDRDWFREKLRAELELAFPR